MGTLHPHRPRRATEVSGDRPPPFDLEIRRRLLTLLLANALPLFAVAVVAIGVAQGRWTLKPQAGRGLVPLLMMLGACVVLLVSTWIVMPLGRWLRDRPAWHFHHGRRLVWVMPYAAGWCAWAACWVAGVGAGLAALAMIGVCLVRLAQVWSGT